MLRREKRESAAHAFTTGADGLEDATDREEMELFASSGTTLTELDAGEVRRYAPEAVARVRARIRRRRQLNLPRRECVAEDPEPEAGCCECLREVLDDPQSETLTRAGVIRRATKAHRELWAWTKSPKVRPPRPEPVSRPEKPRPAPRPIPRPDRATETNTRPARVIKRSPKWFDPHPPSVGDMQF